MFQKSESKEFNYPAAMEVFVFVFGAIAELASLEPSRVFSRKPPGTERHLRNGTRCPLRKEHKPQDKGQMQQTNFLVFIFHVLGGSVEGGSDIKGKRVVFIKAMEEMLRTGGLE